MGIIDRLLARFRRMGVLLLIGVFLIIYVAFGFLYWQQGARQRDLEKQIANISVIVAKELPSAEKLQAEYDAVNSSLAPMPASDAIAILVGIAEKSGIDVSESADNFRVPSATPRDEKVGESTYQVLSFKNISVQGSYDNVMAFISDLDSGKTPEAKTMVLKRVDIKQIVLEIEGEEVARKTEFADIQAAVHSMMTANGLITIPGAISYAGGTASNDMAAFPDSFSSVAGGDKMTDPEGYDYADATDKAGYTLYGHDITGSDEGNPNPDQADVNYTSKSATTYYYTCEADGTIHQFGGPDVATAKEHFISEEVKTETVATLDVDLYTKPGGDSL